MNCPQCKHHIDKVIDKRDQDSGTITRRRRRCKACGHTWTTYEVAMTPEKFRFYDGDIAKERQTDAERKVDALVPLVVQMCDLLE